MSLRSCQKSKFDFGACGINRGPTTGYSNCGLSFLPRSLDANFGISTCTLKHRMITSFEILMHSTAMIIYRRQITCWFSLSSALHSQTPSFYIHGNKFYCVRPCSIHLDHTFLKTSNTFHNFSSLTRVKPLDFGERT